MAQIVNNKPRSRSPMHDEPWQSGIFTRKYVKEIHWAVVKTGVFVFNHSPWLTVAIEENESIVYKISVDCDGEFL